MSVSPQLENEINFGPPVTQTNIAGYPIPSADNAEDRLERVEAAVVVLYRALMLAGRHIDDLSRKLDALQQQSS
jgi:hypothetical protein